MPDITEAGKWFGLCSLNNQFGYILACAIADRQQSAEFWASEDSDGKPQSEYLAADAARSLEIMREIQASFAKGEIVVDRIIPAVDAPLMPPYNGDPADGTAPSHRDW